MKSPKYTDKNKYPVPYRKADNTDITRTWARIREQLEKDKLERAEKVRTIKQIGKR
jgi:hypothetical protein